MTIGDLMGKLRGKKEGEDMNGETSGAFGTPSAKIGKSEIRKAYATLEKYKGAKASLETKIVENEQFWKLKQWGVYSKDRQKVGNASAWLWNCIVSKHADFIDGYPSPNIIPRMPDDVEEAKRLSSVLPIVLEQCDFRSVYDDVCYYKLKQGTGVYGIFWDSDKLNGLGDISIRKIDLLKLFWEPGVSDIQDSANVFLVELIDNEVLKRTYPEIRDLPGGYDSTVKKYIYDDSVDTSEKSAVIDWYYKVKRGPRTVLHYVKFVGDTVLYASENDTAVPMTDTVDPVTGETVQTPTGESVSEKGFYAHGMYPFVFDTLFKIEGTIAGYGYTDIGKGAQEEIDILNRAITKNARHGAAPRHFVRVNGNINEDEYADLDREIIHVEGSLDETNIRTVEYKPLQGNYLEFLQSKIEELKEVTGNRDVNTGGSTSGITAASAIAVMQEAGSKQSRDAISGTYNAFRFVVYFCIELMREFYSSPRYFRITGDGGQTEFAIFDNSGIQPQYQGVDFGQDMGYRTPVFDIEVTAEKASPYKKMERNELAVQMYQLGVFNPQMTDQALLLLDTMDFEGKEQIMDKIRASGTAYDMMLRYQQLALSLAAKYEPETAQIIASQMGGGAPIPGGDIQTGTLSPEDSRIENVRRATQERTQPN